MPRNYVPKQKIYSDLGLQKAVEKIQNGELSYREAECKYNIDKSLLWRRVHNYNTSKQGRKTVLSKKEEDLAEKIKIMAKWGWALTRTEIKEIVHTYICQNNIKNNFKDNYPGKDWLQLFFNRNGLVGKKMEQLEKSRRQATSDPFIIYNFYEILEETLTALDLNDKPHLIFNLDETSFSSDPTRIKGVAGKGQKAHRIIQVIILFVKNFRYTFLWIVTSYVDMIHFKFISRAPEKITQQCWDAFLQREDFYLH